MIIQRMVLAIRIHNYISSYMAILILYQSVIGETSMRLQSINFLVNFEATNYVRDLVWNASAQCEDPITHLNMLSNIWHAGT